MWLRPGWSGFAASYRDMPRVAPLTLLVCLAAADVVLGASNITGTFALPVFLASGLTTSRWTAAVGALATVCAIALCTVDDVGLGPGFLRIATVACASALSVWMAARRAARERQLADMTRVADVAQRAILAPVPPVSGAFAFASAYVSASREAAIGGDLLDVVPMDSGAIRVVMGDVRGKGLAAVRLSAMMLASFREMALTLPTLAEVPRQLERRLALHLGPEDFITAVFAELRPDGELMLINCAHPPPLLFRDGSTQLLDTEPPTTPFGLSPDPTTAVVQLQPHDRVLFYTDGLVEARSSADGRFLPLDRIAEPVASGGFEGAVDGVLTRVRAGVGGQLHDDLALLLTEFRGFPFSAADVIPLNRSSRIERIDRRTTETTTSR